MAKEQCTQSFYHSSKFRNSIVRCILRVIYQFDIAIRYAFAIQLHALVAIIIVKCLDQKRERIRRWVGIDRSKEIQLVTRERQLLWPFLAPRERKRRVEWNSNRPRARPTRCFIFALVFNSTHLWRHASPNYPPSPPPPTTFFYPTLKIPSLQASKQNEHFSTSIEIEARRYHRECCHPRNTNISIFRNFYFPSLLIRYCESMIKFNTI